MYAVIKRKNKIHRLNIIDNKIQYYNINVKVLC